ncbi:hypothetical protein DB347_19670 [Opitutaceae bacterium EW11]|nr:hypothetical protein DB347_19670 [Opitutaceae bacterium EW11]
MKRRPSASYAHTSPFLAALCRWLSIQCLLLAVTLPVVNAAEAAAAPAPSSAGVRWNQLGFLSDAPKRFVVAAGAEVAAGAAFEIRRAGETSVLYRGKLGAKIWDERKVAGEEVAVGDFSEMAENGSYELVFLGSATPFSVGDAEYRSLRRDALRCFRLIRAGVALRDPESGIEHGPSHTEPVAVEGREGKRDLSGGWYNAGDFGRWTHMAAISCSYFMTLWETGAGAFPDDFDLADATPGPNPLLRETRWGLEWMLKMQNPDGSVLHKVDSEPQMAWGKAPDHDPHISVARGASSIDAGVFCGAMYQASRVFAKIDPAFAERCSGAADRAWRWLEINPDVRHRDPYYVDANADSETLWAACERWLASRDPAVGTEVQRRLAQATAPQLGWTDPGVFGVFSIARLAPPGAVQDLARSRLSGWGDQLAELSGQNAFRVALPPEGYSWESAERVLHSGALLAMAYQVTGAASHRDAAIAQVDWVLGHSALGISLVTGHGAHRVCAPYHWAQIALGKTMPGWTSGGPNAYPDGADEPLKALQKKGTPPALCFLDRCSYDGSWASNEGETSENAALVYLIGWMCSEQERVSARAGVAAAGR